MSDLNAFFAKKKDKKKKTVVKLEEVGNLLERKAKKQEEREREESEDVKNGEVERSPEESEWLDYESSTNKMVEGLRIKDMAEEVTETVAETQEEKETEKEQTKTWATIEKKETAPELIPTADEYAAANNRRYVPPSQRGFTTVGGPKIDLNNQEMFPTFAAAAQIEKHKKDEVNNAWTTAGPRGGDGPKTGAYVPPKGDAWGRSDRGAREDALAAVRAMRDTAPPAPVRAPVLPEPDLKKSANAYVPPHLRNADH